VNSSPNSDIDSAVSKIAALREAWIAAVKASDADRLSSMVTDDVVVVRGNGRCVCGKNELRADFLRGFEQFAIDQRGSSAEVIVRDKWAFEIGEVESTLHRSREVHKSTLTQELWLCSSGSRIPHGGWPWCLGC
jgi:ketosteroid isomerase-like protein